MDGGIFLGVLRIKLFELFGRFLVDVKSSRRSLWSQKLNIFRSILLSPFFANKAKEILSSVLDRLLLGTRSFGRI